jgi:endonuclease/exonuclease/phosphatase family metal-dependent hydrolase
MIRMATWNIHGGEGQDQRRDLMRIAELLRIFDFVALQEVQGPGVFGGADQAEFLGRRLEMAWLFAPAVRQWYYRQSGNGLLSKMPIGFWQRLPLPRSVDYSYRNMVLCEIKPCGFSPSGRSIRVLITHVNRRHDAERRAQLQAVIAMFLSLQEPAVLLGDLNSTPQTPQIAQLLKTDGVLDPVGKILGPKVLPERIDWILARGMICRGAGCVETKASDHPLVWAELEVSCN